ncbi:tetratricopeptide repeat protein [Marinobacterium sediminicola]|uniref:TPR repeat n=1 Tax=Marinobacterium sediminicola TaxID=518898 RepID=A0ABY1S3A5_9GAMM|nr:tetratricopeptide repeat protein [Marinobacterium sediminicola]ULG69295.1 sel1 repeat family protein [Marinobacterium sediminicola]SMR77646.1 TPR repeat [Marinobacterium sediminicola]
MDIYRLRFGRMLKDISLLIFLILIFGLSSTSYSATNSLHVSDLYEEYKRKAVSGDMEAMYQLYRFNRYGVATEIDTNAAFNYLKGAAAKGHLDALKVLARAYERGAPYLERHMLRVPYIEPDSAVANKIRKKLYALAAELSDDENMSALLILARAYDEGVEGVIEADPLAAFEYYERAFRLATEQSKQGDYRATNQLYRMFLRGNSFVNKDLGKAAEMLIRGSEQGDPTAKLKLARILVSFEAPAHEFIKPDLAKGIKLLEELTNLGDRGGMKALAFLYSNPEYNMLDLNKSRSLLSKAVEQLPCDEVDRPLQAKYDMDLRKLAEIELELGLYESALERLMDIIDLVPHPNYARLKTQVGFILEIFSDIPPKERSFNYLPPKYEPLYDWFHSLPLEKKKDYSDRLLSIIYRIAEEGEQEFISPLKKGWGRYKYQERIGDGLDLAEIYRLLINIFGENGYSLPGIEKSPKKYAEYFERMQEAKKYDPFAYSGPS